MSIHEVNIRKYRELQDKMVVRERPGPEPGVTILEIKLQFVSRSAFTKLEEETHVFDVRVMHEAEARWNIEGAIIDSADILRYGRAHGG